MSEYNAVRALLWRAKEEGVTVTIFQDNPNLRAGNGEPDISGTIIDVARDDFIIFGNQYYIFNYEYLYQVYADILDLPESEPEYAEESFIKKYASSQTIHIDDDYVVTKEDPGSGSVATNIRRRREVYYGSMTPFGS